LLFIHVPAPLQSGDSLDGHDRWIIDHVLDYFGDVSAPRSLQFLLDHHAKDDADVVVLFDLLTVHSNL
jgi:hypothetical protein